VAFTYSGNPSLMKMFEGKFLDAIARLKPPLDAVTVQNLIETVLSMMDVVDSDPDGLHMLCGIVIPGKEMRLVHTERKAVRHVSDHHYVGAGDSSVLRYLLPTLTKHSNGFAAWQAINVGVYLTLQAKRYVDGCGGDTDVLTLTPSGRIRPSEAHHIEQDLLKLEFLMDRAATALFDLSLPDEEFKDHLNRFVEGVEEQREELKIRPVFE
jgi:hypothetical protein